MDEIDDILEEAMDDSNYEGSVDYSPHKPKGINSCIFWKNNFSSLLIFFFNMLRITFFVVFFLRVSI